MDADRESHGGARGLFETARAALPLRFPHARTAFVNVDTQAEDLAATSWMDSIHVPGTSPERG